MSARYTQSKAETQKHLEILKGMLRRPENKLCADCKRNDPRWASTNLGCFMCIRCSGIHRGMGVHITRIKSVDLDTWTPEQIENIQKWGNKRANLYWEAHLKPGHVPPEHKMESFIRSKYELKRWASQGPPPEDPSTLETGDAPASSSTATAPAPTPASRKSSAAPPAIDLFGSDPTPPASSRRTASSIPSKSAAAPPASSTSNSLFDLDFKDTPAPRAPQPAAAPSQPFAAAPAPAPAPPKRDAKADILSLFSVAPPPRPVPQQQQPAPSASAIGGLNAGLSGLSFGAADDSNDFGNFGGSGSGGWGSPAAAPAQAPPPVPSVNSQGFGHFTSPSAAPQPDPFSSTTSASIWGNPSTTTTTASSPPRRANATNDPFAEFGAFTAGGGGGGGSGASANVWGDHSSTQNKGSSGAGGGGFSDIWA
ncbi:hypothetical protein JCM3766R1_000677 [Sporobolomyces carnicolor]